MSENTNEPELPESDEHLESLLKKLEPESIDVGLLESLHRGYCLSAAEEAHDPFRPHWKRAIPLALVGCIGMLAYASFRYGPDLQRVSEPKVVQSEPTLVESPVAGAVAENSPSSNRFKPVSAQGFMVNASSGGVVETEQGPQERMVIEYHDAYHWHDPETGTNIRFFQPRNEEVIVPLQTD